MNDIIAVYREFVKFGPNMEDIFHQREAIGWTDDEAKAQDVIDSYKNTHAEWEHDTVGFHHQKASFKNLWDY